MSKNSIAPLQDTLVLGDLHIVVKDGNTSFETIRLTRLVKEILKVVDKNTLLVFAGDTFDKNRPSLEEIKLFYYLVEKLQKKVKDIIVIAGNHDKTTFNYLPASGFTFIAEPEVMYGIQFIPWTHIHSFVDAVEEISSIQVCISHARCTLNDFIKEEVDLTKLSAVFSKIILGDIHYFHKPKSNIHYTSSPSSTVFTQFKENMNGFIKITPNLQVEEYSINIPRRELVVFNSVKASENFKIQKDNLYKFRILDSLENLQVIDRTKDTNVSYELIPKVAEEKINTSYQEQLAKSVYEQLMDHMKKFTFSSELQLTAINRLKAFQHKRK